jgi:hypothetical protein
MRLKTIHAAVAGALLLGGATTTLAQQYYVVQPVATEGVVVQERVVTEPAPAVVIPGERVVTQPRAVVPGERITMTYTVDDAYPFPSPQSSVTQTGVFVPTEPRLSNGTAATESRAHRNFNSNGIFNTD